MAATPKNQAKGAGKAPRKTPARRVDQVTISGLPLGTRARIARFVDGVSVKQADVTRNALLAGVRQFEADGYEVVSHKPINRKTA